MAFFVIFGCYRAYLFITDGFEASHIKKELPYNSAWEISELTPEENKSLNNTLSQPYSYLGKGAQSYAFVSDDGKYVLKFFKYKHLIPNPVVKFVPDWPEALSDWKKNYYLHKDYRFKTLFDGHHLAYTKDKDNAALVYIHLNTNGQTPLKTILIDKLGRRHEIDLNRTAFVLQKKGITARNLLNAQLKNNDIIGAWGTIRDMLIMLITEYNLGIYDRDHGVLHNVGFVDGKPFHLDVGKLTEDITMKELDTQADDLFKVVHRILPWIHNHYPEHEPLLKQRMQDMLSIYLERDFKIDR